MSEEKKKYPWWVKIVAGGIILLGLNYFVPLYEIVLASLYTILIPLMVLFAFGLISWGVVERFPLRVQEIRDRVEEKISHHTDELAN